MVTTMQAAGILGVSQGRVAAMIRAGRLKAQKVGRDWLIAEKDLEAAKDRKPGRPRAANKPGRRRSAKTPATE